MAKIDDLGNDVSLNDLGNSVHLDDLGNDANLGFLTEDSEGVPGDILVMKMSCAAISISL